MTRLRICDACSRHVFVTETHCPFCAVRLAAVRGVPKFKLDRRMSRAQRIALAGAVAGLLGCRASGPGPEYGAPPAPRDAGQNNVFYGGAGGAPPPANVDAGRGVAPPLPMYGLAVPPDGGRTTPGTGGAPAPTDVDAGGDDAGDEDAGMA
jgi:hypothetical protein